VWIRRQGRRLIYHAPRGHPEQRAWAQIARGLGASVDTQNRPLIDT